MLKINDDDNVDIADDDNERKLMTMVAQKEMIRKREN